MEAVLTASNPADSEKLIASEDKKLEEAQRRKALMSNDWIKYMMSSCSMSESKAEEIVRSAKGWVDAAKQINKSSSTNSDRCKDVARTLRMAAAAQEDFNAARKILGLKPFPLKTVSFEELSPSEV
ncbi:MAG TPA: hypothetical protein VGE54_02430 [Brevundimonas sp.]